MKDIMFAVMLVFIGSDVNADVVGFDWESGTTIHVETDGADSNGMVNYFDPDIKNYRRAHIEYGEDNILVLCDPVTEQCRELEIGDWE